MGKMKKSFILALLLISIVLLPSLVGNPYFTHILIMSGLSILLALGLNFAVGFGGQMSFAQAAFYGIGAYGSALLSLKLGWSFWVAFPLAAILAGLFGFFLGLITIRLGGYYLVIATLGFQKIVELTISHWNTMTRGTMGITGIPSPEAITLPGLGTLLKFDDINAFYYFILVLVALVIFAALRVKNSRLGLELRATKEDEMAARSVGVKSTRVKVIAFTMSAIAAGAAGSFFAHYVHNIHPESFNVGISFSILLMVIIGGTGTIAGPILGAVFLTVLPEYLRFFQDYKLILFGFTLMVFVIFFPGGLVGLYDLAARKYGRRAERGGD
jgi:branched-chain amino acid transport system permease protein